MIGPYASEIAKHESDSLISDKRPRISLRDIIAEHVQSILKPELLAETYRERALWGRRLVPNLGTTRLPHVRKFELLKVTVFVPFQVRAGTKKRLCYLKVRFHRRWSV